MRKKNALPMNLQFFAEGDGPGAGEGNGAGTDGGAAGTAGESGQGNAGGNEPPSFDDILKGGHQAEFDRRLQKAVNTAVTKAQEKWQVLTDDKLSEADKLAKMTKEEKTQYLQQKKEKELTDKEAAITRRELMAEAKNTLAEKKIPVKLAELLNYADADTCKHSMAALEASWQEAVQAGVEERMKGDKPPKKAPGQEDTDLAKRVENLMMGN